MSEYQPNFETGKSAEIDPKKLEKLAEDNYERMEREAEAAKAERDPAELMRSIQEKIDRAAQSKESIKLDSHEASGSETAHFSSVGLISQANRKNLSTQTLKRVQKQLPKGERAFSKVVHQPAVEAVSNVAESTVARPSGLFVGGLFSLISSLVLLYICRHYGYEYNFLIGLAGFTGGFILGLFFEALYKIFSKLLKPHRS